MGKKLTKKKVEQQKNEPRINVNLPAMYSEFIDKVAPSYGGTAKSTVIFALTKYCMDHSSYDLNYNKKKRLQIEIPKELRRDITDRLPKEAFTQSQFVLTAIDFLRFNIEQFGEERVYDTDYITNFDSDMSLNVKILDFRDNYSKEGTVFNILGKIYLDEDEPPVLVELKCPVMLYIKLLEKEIEVGKSYLISRSDGKFTVRDK